MTDFVVEVRDRRVLPAVGVYVAGVWVLIEILDRLVERYLLSPYLTDVVFWGLYSLIPAVMMIAWTHGRPGKDRVSRLEKVGVPINIIVTLGLLFTVFGDKDLSLAATEVTFNNELGQQETHFITSESFRRRMAVFFWKNESGNPDLDWLQYGVTELLVQDLQQDPFVLASSPWNNFANGFYSRMRQAGFHDGLNVPRSLMRKIADRANRQYFVEGALGQQGSDLVVTARIWDTNTLAEVAEITEAGPDIYTLMDRISKQVRRALDVPESSGRIAEDLPLVETYGNSEDALKAYISGLNARLFENDFTASNRFFDEAIQIDPNFVLAWLAKSINAIESGNLAGAQEALAKAQALDYRLPSRDRAQLKFILYRLSGEHEKVMSFLQLQAKIYDDSVSHDRLAGMYMVTGELEKAKAESLLALERDALNVGIYRRLSTLERATGNMDEAIKYAKIYQEQRPEDHQAQMNWGDLLRDSGDLDGALSHYQQAQLLQSVPVDPILRQADIAARKGDLKAAKDYLAQAGEIAGSPAQKARVLQSTALQNVRLGKIRDAIDQTYASEEFLKQASGLLDVTLSVYAPLIDYFLALDDIDAARQALDIAKSMLPPPSDQFMAFSEAVILASEDNPESAKMALQDAIEVVEKLQLKFLYAQVHIVEATIAEATEDYNAMVTHHQEAIKLIRRSVLDSSPMLLLPLVYADLADAQINLGDLAGADQSIEAGFLLNPFEPTLWTAKARLQQAREMPLLAQASVNYALAIWRDADEDYIRAQRARELAAELAAAIQ
jgi:tetratricopeptide (TPR) repeat protein